MNGEIQYIDEWTAEQKAEARRKIIAGLKQDLETAFLGPGDTLVALFHLGRDTTQPYVIGSGDKLNIQFLHDPARNLVIKVRPDGVISLPIIGHVTAAGMTVDELAKHIYNAFKQKMKGDPIVTVNVDEFETPVAEFARAIGEGSAGRSRAVTIGPDGTLILPFIPPLAVSGRTIVEVKQAVDAAYQARRLDVSVTLLPQSFRQDRILVFGEVVKPGPVESARPLTVLAAVANAGGVSLGGSLSNVKVFYVAADGLPRIRSVNLSRVLEDLRIEEDMLVPHNSVVYVPPTELAKTGRYLDSVLRDVLRFNGVTFGFNYLLNQKDSVSATVQ